MRPSVSPFHQDDDEKVKAYGIELGVAMCRQLLDAGIEGLHFYTLNLERSTVKIMEGLGLIAKKNAKRLPWVPSQVSVSARASVRTVLFVVMPHFSR
jgi:methylenetetrahydrofolate reductase (NADPH)